MRQKLDPQKKTDNSRKTEAVIISAEGKSYAELLNIVKGKVDAPAMGVAVKAVRETMKGDLLLAVEGGEAKAKMLKEEILKRCVGEGISVRESRSGENTLLIKGIDPTNNEEEVVQGIKTAVGMGQVGITIKALRPAYGGNFNALVTVERTVAKKLLDLGSLKIGWSTARVQEWVEVKRCPRCWGQGHRAGSCKGVDRRNLCLRCCKNSHTLKECNETPFCPFCGVDGHRADSMACPINREAIVKIRERRAQDRLGGEVGTRSPEKGVGAGSREVKGQSVSSEDMVISWDEVPQTFGGT